MIALTPRARAAVLAHLHTRGLESRGLKIYVVAGGCSGFSYDLHFVSAPAATDARFGDDELPIYVDRASLRFVDGTEIDYDDAPGRARGFAFRNPSARGVCSCGASFAL